MAEFAPEALMEIAEASLLELEALEGEADTLDFYYKDVGYVLDEARKRYGHIAEVQELLEAKMQQFMEEWYGGEVPEEGDSDYILEIMRKQRDDSFTWKVQAAIKGHYKAAITQKTLDFANLLVNDMEIGYLRKMGDKFIARNDITRPFPNHPEWNQHRSFPIVVNGKKYTCTLVISSLSRF